MRTYSPQRKRGVTVMSREPSPWNPGYRLVRRSISHAQAL